MNYIGSKYSLIDFITETISSITGYKDECHKTFADLFAGTGIVGATYRRKGYNVISNDTQYYSYVLNKPIIEMSPKVDKKLLDMLNDLQGEKGFVYLNYCAGSGSGRNYFTDYNGMKCDAIRLKLEKLYTNNEIDMTTYFYYLASLINSIDKYANTASVYGAFLKHIKKSASKNFTLELIPIITGIEGKVYNQDSNELIKTIQGDILYLDPPYNTRQYCTNYHVLETIAKYDAPVIRGLTGLREYEKQKSSFCSKRTVVSSFENVIANAKFKYIFLSYNNEGLMDFDIIKTVMSRFGKYECFEKQYKRFKADASEKRNISADTTNEYIHCLIKE